MTVENKMKALDNIELIVEKEQYAKEGVHKGMHGGIILLDLLFGSRMI